MSRGSNISIEVARPLANKCANAYSTDNYGGSWLATVRALLERGYSEAEVEALLRSKHTRWAADSCERHAYGRHNSTCVLHYIDALPDLNPGSQEMSELVRETFTDEETRAFPAPVDARKQLEQLLDAAHDVLNEDRAVFHEEKLSELAAIVAEIEATNR
jgi:hypothetical protein